MQIRENQACIFIPKVLTIDRFKCEVRKFLLFSTLCNKLFFFVERLLGSILN